VFRLVHDVRPPDSLEDGPIREHLTGMARHQGKECEFLGSQPEFGFADDDTPPVEIDRQITPLQQRRHGLLQRDFVVHEQDVRVPRHDDAPWGSAPSRVGVGIASVNTAPPFWMSFGPHTAVLHRE
jgi:hypothetical protein